MWKTLAAPSRRAETLQGTARQLVEHVLAHKNGIPPADEAGNYFLCAKCAQAIDARSFEQLFHHLQPEHSRLTESELTQLSMGEESAYSLFATDVCWQAATAGEA